MKEKPMKTNGVNGSLYTKERLIGANIVDMRTGNQKKCLRCGELKDENDFRHRYDYRNEPLIKIRVVSFCYDCEKIRRNQYKENRRNLDNKKCYGCKKTLPKEMFNNDAYYCVECGKDKQSTRHMKKKQIGIDFLGGCCEKCGITGHYAIFQFHHKYPELKTKETIKYLRCKTETFLQVLVDEKIQLLCANCHAIVHCTKTIDGKINYKYIKKGD